MASGPAAALPVPPPPHPPTVETIAPDIWWRVHSAAFGPDAFNDSGRGDARFSPLFDPAGEFIPTFYAASAARTAVAEMLLHDAPTPSTGWIYDWSRDQGSDLLMSRVQLPALRLAKLTSFGLKAAGLEVAELFAGDANDYPRTRNWAAWFHANMPDIEGLFWMSRRDNEHRCLLLFGDRLAGSLAGIESRPVADFEATVFDVLEALGAGLA